MQGAGCACGETYAANCGDGTCGSHCNGSSVRHIALSPHIMQHSRLHAFAGAATEMTSAILFRTTMRARTRYTSHRISFFFHRFIPSSLPQSPFTSPAHTVTHVTGDQLHRSVHIQHLHHHMDHRRNFILQYRRAFPRLRLNAALRRNRCHHSSAAVLIVTKMLAAMRNLDLQCNSHAA